jgi:hypothetical protein
MLDQFVFADHAVRVSSEIKKKIKNLRLDMDRTRGAFELASVGTYREIIEIYQQLRLRYSAHLFVGSLREITGKSKGKNPHI